MAHKPATARVKVKRQKATLYVEIVDFISPGILERLAQQAGPLLAPKIDNWRALVDSTMLELKQFRLRLQPPPSPTA